MLKTSHIKLADSTIRNIEENIDFKINRVAYLVGSVLPDLNCVYPLHTIGQTLKRFRGRISIMDKTNSIIVKSLTLGIITHYICDYFCYAHNIAFPNPKHAIYERHMRKHIKDEMIHSIINKDNDNRLEEQWSNIKYHIIENMASGESTDEIISSITKRGSDHINYILKTVSYMHMGYIEKTNSTDKKGWSNSITKIEIDIEYATFMCNKIALLILNPSIEMIKVI